MKKIIIFAILIFAIGSVIYYFTRLNDAQTNSQQNGNNIPISQNEKGLVVESPLKDSEISSPVVIKGYTNGDGWNGFEGQVGIVELFDNSGILLGSTPLTATTDWTKPPVSFEVSLNFTAKKDGSGVLVFNNENPSDLEENDRQFTLPVTIKAGSISINTQKVKVYFNNNNLDPDISCNKVFPIEREIPQTSAVARAAIEELLKGATSAEKQNGYFTTINSGVKIQKLNIVSGVATVDFNDQLEYQTGGSCKVSSIRAQITETLKQFSTVKSVVISINGRTEDILQP